MAENEQRSLRNTAVGIVRRLKQNGFAAYWVGGCVRDMLLGRDPVDFDIVTAALPEEIERLFSRTIPVGRKFGVVVVLEDERQFQVATFRAEADYQDGRRPEQVRFGDALADARRRDFTVNGLLFDPVKNELLDWVGGKVDLQARLIRTIGSPNERFGEDHLRMLRAVRLTAQLQFNLESETFAAIKTNAPKINLISAERVREELLRLFRAPHAAQGLELLRASGLLEQVLPEIAATTACDQSPDFHPEGTVFNHLRLMLDLMSPDAPPSLPWSVLLHDVAKPVTASRDPLSNSIHFYGHERIGAVMAQTILERLRFPRKQTEEIVQAVRCHMQFKDVRLMRKATLRRLLMRPTFPLELELFRLDCLASHGGLEGYKFLLEQARELEQQPEVRPPLLKGDDLLVLGMKPGPSLGALLAELREKQLQDELRTPAEALDWVKQRLGEVEKPTLTKTGKIEADS
jgi:poly(A) polymerase